MAAHVADGQRECHGSQHVAGRYGCSCAQGRNTRLQRAGLRDEEALRELINPGFTEVFGVDEATLDNANFRVFGISLMRGKLDWLLHRGLAGVASCAIGNDDYAASDHKWLCADLVLAGDARAVGDLKSVGSARIPVLTAALMDAAERGRSTEPSITPASVSSDDVTRLSSPRLHGARSPESAGAAAEAAVAHTDAGCRRSARHAGSGQPGAA